MAKKYKSEFQKMYEKIERFDPKTGTYAEDPNEIAQKAEREEKAKIPGLKGFVIRNWGYLLGLLGVLIIFILYLTIGRSMFPDSNFWDGLVSFIGEIWIYILAAVILFICVWYYIKYGRHDDGKTFRW